VAGTHRRVPARSEGEAADWRRGSDVRRPEREEAEGYVRTALTRKFPGSKGSVTPPTSRHFSPLVPSVNQPASAPRRRSGPEWNDRTRGHRTRAHGGVKWLTITPSEHPMPSFA